MHQSGDYLYYKQDLTGPLRTQAKRMAMAFALLMPSLFAADAWSAPRFGLTPFPYDFTAEALSNTQSIVEDSGNLYALHFDGCIPWAELLADAPFPVFFQEEWDRLHANIPEGHAVYVGLAPLATDRRSLAPACGPDRDTPAELPTAIRNKGFDNPSLMDAYLRFARRAIEHFDPEFMNVGIEVDVLAFHAPSDWARFEILFDHVRQGIKSDHPNLPIGVSMNPQMLMEEDVGERARGVVERSDYLGLSFYPYASPMAERFGASPLGDGEQRWDKVFDWANQYTDKPVALCETGFITEDIYLQQYDLGMQGDIDSQADYVRAMVDRVKQDGYLFVVWFLAVDYDRLYAKTPEHPGKETLLLWRNSGLFEGDLEPKPAFAEWMRALDTSPENAGSVISPDGRKVLLIPPLENTEY